MIDTGATEPTVRDTSVFQELAEAQIRLRHAQKDRDLVRRQAEQEIVDKVGGVKNLGPNIVDQERVFACALLDEAYSELSFTEDAVTEAEDALDRAKAAVREYECEAGRPVVFHGE